MALKRGTRVGPYEVVAPLGAGGMGEVYRATDTKLKREVAIKVLPEEVGQDRERLARFEREAQVLASLNHPNIASIYGLEETGGAPCLVLELVEGLRRSDERFRIIAENIPGVVYSFDSHPDYPRRAIFIGPGMSTLIGNSVASDVRENTTRARIRAICSQVQDSCW